MMLNMFEKGILHRVLITRSRSEVRSRKSERRGSDFRLLTSDLGFGLRISYLILLLSVSTFIPQNCASQTPKLSDYRTWDLGMSTGVTFPRTDINGKAKFGIGFDFTKFLSQHFAMQARF